MNSPTFDAVKVARSKAGLTQQNAAALIGQDGRAWRRYESGDVAMHPASWELFLLKTGQHPTLMLTPRS